MCLTHVLLHCDPCVDFGSGVVSFNDLDDTDKLCVIVSGVLSCQSLLHHLVKTVFRWFRGPNLVQNRFSGFKVFIHNSLFGFSSMPRARGVVSGVLNYFCNSSAPLYLYCVRQIRHMTKGFYLIFTTYSKPGDYHQRDILFFILLNGADS